MHFALQTHTFYTMVVLSVAVYLPGQYRQGWFSEFWLGRYMKAEEELLSLLDHSVPREIAAIFQTPQAHTHTRPDMSIVLSAQALGWDNMDMNGVAV